MHVIYHRIIPSDGIMHEKSFPIVNMPYTGRFPGLTHNGIEIPVLTL